MGVLKGDFIGFQLGEYHSSELGIVRVSDGTRYVEELSPVPVDKTAERPGSDGTYFFGSYYSQKPININFAFDSLTEEQFRKLKQVFSVKAPQKLIYDETPYKYYLVKNGSAPQFKYICFGKPGERIYKGEGSLALMAYYPYAKSTYKWAEDFIQSSPEGEEEKPYSGDLKCYHDTTVAARRTHWEEWNPGAGIIFKNSMLGKYDVVAEGTDNQLYFNTYNSGDLEADFILTIPFRMVNGKPSHIGEGDYISFEIEGNPEYRIDLNNIKARGQDTFITYNTATNLIEGYYIKDGKVIRSGNVYNNYKIDGSFFKLPLGEQKLYIKGISMQDAGTPMIEYSYLYY